MAIQQSFVGDIPNPITQARVEASISANTLAKKLGISRQYLQRAESGTYSSLNPALLKWVGNEMGWDLRSTEGRYAEFQVAKRRQTVAETQPHKLERHDSKATGSEVFSNWRNGYWVSPMAFAAAFCVHPDLVQRYEEGIQKTMPKQIFQVLLKFDLIDPNWSDSFQSKPAR